MDDDVDQYSEQGRQRLQLTAVAAEFNERVADHTGMWLLPVGDQDECDDGDDDEVVEPEIRSGQLCVGRKALAAAAALTT